MPTISLPHDYVTASAHRPSQRVREEGDAVYGAEAAALPSYDDANKNLKLRFAFFL